jgi:hypothetical protein
MKSDNILQRAYKANIIFQISCAPTNGFELKIFGNSGWTVWHGLKTWEEVKFWLQEHAATLNKKI